MSIRRCKDISWPKTAVYLVTVVIVLVAVIHVTYSCTEGMSPAIRIGITALTGLFGLALIEGILGEKVFLRSAGTSEKKVFLRSAGTSEKE